MNLVDRVPYLSLRDAIVELCKAVDNIQVGTDEETKQTVETVKANLADIESRLSAVEGKTSDLRDDVGEDTPPIETPAPTVP